MNNQSSIHGAEIVKQLVSLGVQPGDKLAVHSSYKALGSVAGGPETVIQALLQVVGEDGVLLMPIFIAHLEPLYDPKKSPSACGIISELFRRRADVRHSYHPSHAVAAWGQKAAWMVLAHTEGRTALGVDSPFDRLAQSGGKVLLMGVGHNRNSMIHVGEAYFKVPYLNVFYSGEFEGEHKVRMEDGSVRSMIIHECPGCSENFGIVENGLRNHGLIKYGSIGQARVQLMKGTDVILAVRRLLSHDPGALLCDNPDCCVCPRARATLGH